MPSIDVASANHKARHAAGGPDAITPADIGAMGEAEMTAAAQAAAAPAAAAAQAAQTSAQSSATSAAAAAARAEESAAAKLEIPDTNVSALVGNPVTDTRKALDATYGPRGASLAPASPAPAPPTGQPVSRFQAGHAWTDAAGGWAVKTDIVMHGSQSWGFDAVGAANHVTRLEFPSPVDVRGKNVVLDCYISDPTKVTSFVASVDSGATGNSNSMNYPPLAARARDAAAWSPWVAHYGAAYDQIGAPDRSAMRRIALRVVTSGPVVFRINSVRFVTQRDLTPAHPNGVIILESDDGGGTNNLFHRVLSEYGIPGTINMIAENADRPDRLTTEQLRTWQADGWDVQGHAYALTSQNYLGLTAAEVDKDMAKLKGWLLENGFSGQFLAYPQGGYNETVKKVAARYFRGGRTVDATPVTAPGLRPYAIAAHSVNNTDSIATITQIMDSYVASGAPLHLVFHHFEDAGDINTTIDAKGWTTGRLRAIVEHGLAKGYTFATYSQVYGDPPPAQATPIVPDWLASDSGFAAWPCDPSMLTTDHAMTTQVQYVDRVKVTRDGDLSLAHFHVGTAGSSVTGGTVDVWSENGTRLGFVAIASYLGTTGPKAVPITVANRHAGEYVYVGIRAIFTGTPPAIRGVGGNPNLGVSGAATRYGTYGTTLSSLTTITPASIATTPAGGAFPWVGLA